MRKLLLTLAVLCGTVSGWAQLVKTSTAESPFYYVIASYDRGGVIKYTDSGSDVKHEAYTSDGKSSWYFEAVPDNANNGVYIVSKYKDGENKVYLGSDRKASKTAAVWYVLKNGVNDFGFSISSTPTLQNNSCLDANNSNTGIGTYKPKEGDWQGTTWVFLGDIENATYNPENKVMQSGTGGRRINSITINNKTHNTPSCGFAFVDHTENVTFYVASGSEISISIGRAGNWMHAYVYVDKDANGFTKEDSVSYSYLSSTGKNSAGVANGNNTVALPNFTAPETVGTYRLRVKYDWDDLNPNDGKDFATAGSQFVDVTLNVLEKDEFLRRELGQLIEEATSGLYVIPLQTTDPNGAFYLSAVQDADGNNISKAIDGNPSTFYGSTWGSSLGYQHYWQVDLSNEQLLTDFTFSIVTRAGGSDTPTKINIKGSTNGIDFDLIQTVEGLPTEGGASYTSEVITNNGYRFIRFEVPETKNNYHPLNKEEVTIAIAEFSMKDKDESSYAALTAAIAEAEAVLGNPDATYEQLDDAYKKLLCNKEQPTYPFVLTKNSNNPIPYAIKTGRDNDLKEWWYTYDSSDSKIYLTQYTGEEKQLWYFKDIVFKDESTGNYKHGLQLFPYIANGKVMSYENTKDGADKIVAKDLNTDGWHNIWVFVTTNGGTPYALQTYDGKNYLSNNGGVTKKMGMWNAGPTSDTGTAMYIIDPAEYLADLIADAKTYTSGNTVGSYTEAAVASLQSVIKEAEENLLNKNYCFTTLKNAIDALEINMPQANKYYVLRCSYESRYVHANANNKLNWVASGNANPADSKYIWQFEPADGGKFKMKSVHNQSYISTIASGDHITLNESGANVTISKGNTAGTVVFEAGNAGVGIHANSNPVIGYTNAAGSNSYFVEEVESFSHKLSIGDAEWSSLVLGYNTEIPAGVSAYVVDQVGNNNVVLSQVYGILPANTPILVNASKSNYDFTYSAETPTVTNNGNLVGTLVNTYIADEAYVLSKPTIDGVAQSVGFYKATLNKNENGAEGKTHFLNNANKAYLPAPDVAGARFLVFDFGGTETGIDELKGENGNVKAEVYDLAGRRVLNAKKGVFVVNGKVIVK